MIGFRRELKIVLSPAVRQEQPSCQENLLPGSFANARRLPHGEPSGLLGKAVSVQGYFDSTYSIRCISKGGWGAYSKGEHRRRRQDCRSTHWLVKSFLVQLADGFTIQAELLGVFLHGYLQWQGRCSDLLLVGHSLCSMTSFSNTRVGHQSRQAETESVDL